MTRRVLKVGLAALIVGPVYTFLLAPVIVVVAASFDGGDMIAGRAFARFPPHDLSVQWYLEIQPSLWHALGVSVLLGLVAASVGTILGVPAAIGLVRSRVPGKTLIGALFRAPLQIPFIVIGIAFLQTYYLISAALDLHLVGSFFGLALGHILIATPYVVGSVGAVLQRFNPSIEEAALSLGASWWRTFRRVTLPCIMPGVYAGALFAFIISFGDVPVSLFLVGPKFTTLPLEIFHSMELDFDTTVLAISTVVVVGSAAALWAVQRLIGLDVLLRSSGRG